MKLFSHTGCGGGGPSRKWAGAHSAAGILSLSLVGTARCAVRAASSGAIECSCSVGLPVPTARSGRGRRRAPSLPLLESRSAFTIVELLVVISIIALLAAVGLPAIRGMTKSNNIIAADRQLLDEIAYARLRAISDHTTVYMVFIPPAITDVTQFPLPPEPNAAGVVSNLYGGQYTTYALVSLRTVGDQPGRSTPRYLSGWRSLPSGVYIATNKFEFVPNLAPPFFNVLTRDVAFPFPGATNSAIYHLPYLAFNYLGQMVNGEGQLVSSLAPNQQPEYIPLARGSIFYARDANGNFAAQPADVLETPVGDAYYHSYNTPQMHNGQPLLTETNKAYNQIHIDPLTGRVRVESPRIQ
jgi:prepilin-type N-terminal cleavage/methylation domain-containing protein